ncbi:hypothetical protein IQ07DRAFT_643214 [Pyrenochaeta sp. DS3sAY3a]|nr:hypothetical protein IQ07DRAFT_643214 [Pyrenochaeta sp. DS3sAY3a]
MAVTKSTPLTINVKSANEGRMRATASSSASTFIQNFSREDPPSPPPQPPPSPAGWNRPIWFQPLAPCYPDTSE